MMQTFVTDVASGLSRTIRASLSIAILTAGRVALAQNPAPDHPEPYAAADIAAGAELYGRFCMNCHGASGTGVGGIDLHRGMLPRARTDEALRSVIANGFPQAGMPPFRLQPDEVRAIVAFVRAGGDLDTAASPVALGDAAVGRTIFESKGKCLECHRVGHRGGFAGPELTDIGRARPASSIRGALLTPTAFMRPINRPVRAVTRSGAVITGRRLNEDTYAVQVMTDDGRLIGLVKSELTEWHVGATSPMPSYQDALTPAELADLLAYVVTLKDEQAPPAGTGRGAGRGQGAGAGRGGRE
jgi:putative heme-binding domain-containing protein